ncbi:MAG: hypothetical protein AAF483_16985 [Planctomycetota bacterium]
MGTLKWIIGGIVGGLIGGFIWVLIGYYANAEVGYVAWGIGLLVGICVQIAANTNERDDGAFQAIGAAVIALLAVIGAKYVVFLLVVGQVKSEMDNFTSDIDFNSDETNIMMIADDLIEERVAAGKPVAWPPGMSIEEADEQADYPPRIWKEASKQWNDLSPEEQESEKAARKLAFEMIMQGFFDDNVTFAQTFSPFDALWIILAVATAFRIGGGDSDD